MKWRIEVGDCREVMRTMPDASVDSIVTDPPYGLSFMGKGWDHGVPGVEFWVEALRVAKPGSHLLAFGGTRTYHRLACAIEDAGWEIRDCIMWVYGSGFPKSHDVSKAIDKAAGAEREVISERENRSSFDPNAEGGGGFQRGTVQITAPATDAARKWSGWGTALKPAYEPIIVARKPLVGTVAQNVLQHGTGALNIDGCRVAGESTRRTNMAEMGYHGGNFAEQYQTGSDEGRWPANLIHDGSDEVVRLFPDVGGSAHRFFYCAKASRSDRDAGLDGNAARANHHPTVKPTELMRYLCRLVTPPGGVVLDPFTGSGSTGRGAVIEGFDFIGIDLGDDYADIARARIMDASLNGKESVDDDKLDLFGGAS